MPVRSDKLYITNAQGKFEIKEDVDYREAFYDLEDCVLIKKLYFVRILQQKNIMEQVLKKDKNSIF